MGSSSRSLATELADEIERIDRHEGMITGTRDEHQDKRLVVNRGGYTVVIISYASNAVVVSHCVHPENTFAGIDRQLHDAETVAAKAFLAVAARRLSVTLTQAIA